MKRKTENQRKARALLRSAYSAKAESSPHLQGRILAAWRECRQDRLDQEPLSEAWASDSEEEEE